MQHPWLSLVAIVFAGVAVAAPQQPSKFTGRSFVPPEPRAEVWVDFRAMRDSGVWDGVTSSMLRALLSTAEHNLGFALDDVDVLRGYPEIGEDDEAAPRNDTGIVIFEGNERLLAPTGAEGTKADRFAGHDVVVTRDYWPGDPTAWIAPTKGVLVYGSRHLIEPALMRTRPAGVTPPELLSLSAGRGVQAHIVMACHRSAQRGIVELLSGGSAGDAAPLTPPEFLMLRLRCEEQKDQGETSLFLDGCLRWAQAEAGPAAAAERIRLRLDEARKHPRLAALKHLWSKIAVAVDGRDVTLQFALGRPREAGGIVALLVPMLWLTTPTAQSIEPETVETAAPAPADQPAGPHVGQPKEPPKNTPEGPGGPGKGGNVAPR